MKHQVLFFLKKNEKVFMNVVCCSRDLYFKLVKKVMQLESEPSDCPTLLTVTQTSHKYIADSRWDGIPGM